MAFVLGACSSTSKGSGAANRAPVENKGATNKTASSTSTAKTGSTATNQATNADKAFPSKAAARSAPPSRAATDSGGGAISTPIASPGAAAAGASSATAKPRVDAAKPGAFDIKWLWPTTSAQVAEGFNESKNKGLNISGKAGDAIFAAADGRVVYAGSGLRGYGNLIILKHNDTYLSAYAHNQALLVKEDQTVTQGQKIAEMGQSDSDKVNLHFEIRKQGKPVDPALYLPKQ